MGQDRKTSCVPDGLDGFCWRDDLSFSVIRPVRIQVFFKGLVHRGDAPFFNQGPGKVRPGDHCVRIFHDQVLHSNRKAVLLEGGQHELVAAVSFYFRLIQKIQEGFICMVNIQPQDMDLFFFIQTGELHAGNHLQREIAGGRQGLSDTGNGIMVR